MLCNSVLPNLQEGSQLIPTLADGERETTAGAVERKDTSCATGTLLGTGRGLTVSGSIDGYNCNLIVDTGSEISIVHPDILQSWKRENLQPVTPTFRTVTGQKAPMLGKCELSIRVGSTELSKPVWVADIQDPCILLALISWTLWGVLSI